MGKLDKPTCGSAYGTTHDADGGKCVKEANHTSEKHLCSNCHKPF